MDVAAVDVRVGMVAELVEEEVSRFRLSVDGLDGSER